MRACLLEMADGPVVQQHDLTRWRERLGVAVGRRGAAVQRNGAHAASQLDWFIASIWARSWVSMVLARLSAHSMALSRSSAGRGPVRPALDLRDPAAVVAVGGLDLVERALSGPATSSRAASSAL